MNINFKAIASYLMKKKEPARDIPDDETTDKQLRSLRRQRRIQKEEVEKQRLIKSIQSYNNKKDAALLRNDHSILREKKRLTVRRGSDGFLGRGGLL